MSGHAILDSCHNCGAKDVQLKVVHQSASSNECGFGEGSLVDEKPYHHIHVTVACLKCRRTIWGRNDET